MCNHNPHVNNEIFDEHINFAEMLAEEAREGGIYYQLIKDLHVEKVIPFEGDWNDNKKEGKGILYLSNGDRIVGDYLNDKCIGKHVLFLKNGEIHYKIFS